MSLPVDPQPENLSPAAKGDAVHETALLRGIVRCRWLILAAVFVILLAGYNGQWRIARDSALYRAVGQNLAAGRGYTFRGEPERHIFPGLPLLLAGVEKVFGPQDPLAPRASQITMMVIAGLTLVCVYHLVRLHFPVWLAVCVTTGVGINPQFVSYSHEIMTDVPFMLGVFTTLLALGHLVRAARWSHGVGWATLLAVGVTIAISMRPTVWALALAWMGACLIGMMRSPRRGWYALGLATAAALVVLWYVADPRTVGANPFTGKYEQHVLQRMELLGRIDWIGKLRDTFATQLPEAFLGFELPWPLAIPFVFSLLFWSVALGRKSPLWALYVLVTVAMTVLIGSRPRYYLMILPLLLSAWGIGTHWTSRRVARWRWAPQVVMLGGLGLATLPNLVLSMKVVLEQHGINRRLQSVGFLRAYHDGRMLDLYHFARLINQKVPMNERVLGSESRILSFLSGRSVYEAEEVLEGLKPDQWSQAVRACGPHWCAYGKGFKQQRMMSQLLSWRIVQPDIHKMYQVPGVDLTLARIREIGEKPAKKPRPPVLTPATRPVKPPVVKPPKAKKPATRPATRPSVSKLPTTKSARQPATSQTDQSLPRGR